MSEIAEFRCHVLAQPETAEGKHFRTPADAVRARASPRSTRTATT
ncbi:hypothetical protein ACWDKQ_19725 [Saccharopolyspora sp. NPDC000995]